jgi:hypothetical protein
MLRGHVPFLYRLAPLLGFILVIQAPPALAARRPVATSTITVVKTRPAPKVKTEEYRVKGGEHLWQILRARLGEGASERRIARLYNQTLRLNPGLKPQLLSAGHVLRLPVTGQAAQAAQAEATMAEPAPETPAIAAPVAPPGEDPEVLAAARAASEAAERAAAQAAAEAAAETARRDTERKKAAASEAGHALSALYAELGEETINRGKHFIPLPETGQMVLDAANFPLLQVGGSTRFVLDPQGRIPPEVDALLLEAGGYRILRYDQGRGLRGMLDDAFAGSGLDVRRSGRLKLSGSREAEVEAGADWLVIRGERRELVYLISRPEEATSVAVARHLARRGVQVIDILAPEDAPPQVLRRAAGSLPPYEPPEVAEDAGEVISRVLAMLGQSYERHAAVPLFGEDLPGFDLKCNADFGFERGGQKYLVGLEDLSPRWRELLEKRGYQVLIISGDVRGQEAAARLLKFLGQRYDEGFLLSGSARPEGSNIRLRVPGLLVNSGQRRFLLSESEADEGLACALSQAGLRVIQLK